MIDKGINLFPMRCCHSFDPKKLDVLLFHLSILAVLPTSHFCISIVVVELDDEIICC